MTKKYTIPLVEIELADNLYIQIKDVSFIPATKGVYNALPENCYPDEPAEIDWLNENAKLVIKEQKTDMTYTEIMEYRKMGKPFRWKTVEKEFTVDDSFFYEYYEEIIKVIEEMEE